MTRKEAWDRYDELSGMSALGFLSSGEQRELLELRTRFESAPTESELAASAICLAFHPQSTGFPTRLREQILARAPR